MSESTPMPPEFKQDVRMSGLWGLFVELGFRRLVSMDRWTKRALAALGLLVFAFVIMHPNSAIAKVTMILPTHAHIEEYFSQESDARQTCIAFATSHGYDPAYCHHAFYQPLWEAGWLCETYAQWSNGCPAFYLGDFYHPQCPVGQIPNRDTGVCELPPKNNGGGSCNGVAYVGNPVNSGTGNKWQHETDLIGGSFGLTFERYYNASTPAKNANLGSGWVQTYSRSITVQSLGAWVTILRQDGKEYNFNQSAGVWTADADVPDRLDELKDSSNVRIGWRYTTSDSVVETYNADGKFLSITDRSGLSQALTYSDVSTPTSVAPSTNLLIRVTDTFGRELNFTYDTSSRISTLTDPAGGLYQYAYDTNNLVSVTYPDGKSKIYHYENTSFPNALTGITDENGDRYPLTLTTRMAAQLPLNMRTVPDGLAWFTMLTAVPQSPMRLTRRALTTSSPFLT